MASAAYVEVAEDGSLVAEEVVEQTGGGIAQEVRRVEEDVVEARHRAGCLAVDASQGRAVVGKSCGDGSRGRRRRDGAWEAAEGSRVAEDHTIHCDDTDPQGETRVESALAAGHRTKGKVRACSEEGCRRTEQAPVLVYCRLPTLHSHDGAAVFSVDETRRFAELCLSCSESYQCCQPSSPYSGGGPFYYLTQIPDQRWKNFEGPGCQLARAARSWVMPFRWPDRCLLQLDCAGQAT